MVNENSRICSLAAVATDHEFDGALNAKIHYFCCRIRCWLSQRPFVGISVFRRDGSRARRHLGGVHRRVDRHSRSELRKAEEKISRYVLELLGLKLGPVPRSAARVELKPNVGGVSALQMSPKYHIPLFPRGPEAMPERHCARSLKRIGE